MQNVMVLEPSVQAVRSHRSKLRDLLLKLTRVFFVKTSFKTVDLSRRGMRKNHLDHFQILQTFYSVNVGTYSKQMKIEPTDLLSSKATVEILHNIFASFALPQMYCVFDYKRLPQTNLNFFLSLHIICNSNSNG